MQGGRNCSSYRKTTDFRGEKEGHETRKRYIIKKRKGESVGKGEGGREKNE